jgi:hypothetical protein
MKHQKWAFKFPPPISFNPMAAILGNLADQKAIQVRVYGKEVLQKESGRRLCYIYSRCTMYIHGAFSVVSGTSSVKNWHSPRAGREKGSERGIGGGMEWGSRKLQ